VIGQLTLLALIMVAAQSQIVQLLLQIPIDSVALGASPAKMFLFLGYLLLVSFLWYKPPPRASSKPHLVFLALVVLLHIVGIAEYAALCYRFDLGIDFVLFIRDSEISATRLVHTHNAKMIFGAFYPQGSYGHDPGLSFLGYYPLWWVRLHALLFLATFGALLSSVNSMRGQVSGGLYGVYLVAAFMALKTSIDAGLLNHEALVSLPMVSWIVLKARGSDKRWTPYLLAGLSATLFAGVALVYPVNLESAFRFSANILALVLAYAIGSGRRLWSVGLLVMLLALPAARPLVISGALRFPPSGFNTLVYSLKEVGPKDKLFLVAPGKLSIPEQLLKVVRTFELGGYTYAEAEPLGNVQLLSLTQALDLPVHHKPILILGQDCQPGFNTRVTMTAIVAHDPRSEIEKASGRLDWLIESLEVSYLGKDTYHFDIVLKGCVNDNVVGAMLDELGVNQLIAKRYQSVIRK
jgi:hypothetical protein